MKAFRRLDHLLCEVPNIGETFGLLHYKLGFPVAWPVGRYWPDRTTCGIALSGANLELIQPDKNRPRQASIHTLAFEPGKDMVKVLREAHIGFTKFNKFEDDPEILKLRSLPVEAGSQRLCTNTLPFPSKLEFPLFACQYSPILRGVLAPASFKLPGDNALEEVVLGHPDPARLKKQLDVLGIKEGVRISVQKNRTIEVVALIMKNGPIDLPSFPARFKFLGR
jgi:hypothetical protein